jgi:hypothetical protein
MNFVQLILDLLALMCESVYSSGGPIARVRRLGAKLRYVHNKLW